MISYSIARYEKNRFASQEAETVIGEQTMQEIVAVTGGAGFIGSHVAEGFARNGYRVRVLDNLTSGSLANLAIEPFWKKRRSSGPGA
jgi:hypothetical protein